MLRGHKAALEDELEQARGAITRFEYQLATAEAQAAAAAEAEVRLYKLSPVDP